MDSTIIKNIAEKNIVDTDNKSLNEIQITFESSKNGSLEEETITLRGQGSVKVLMPV